MVPPMLLMYKIKHCPRKKGGAPACTAPAMYRGEEPGSERGAKQHRAYASMNSMVRDTSTCVSRSQAAMLLRWDSPSARPLFSMSSCPEGLSKCNCSTEVLHARMLVRGRVAKLGSAC